MIMKRKLPSQTNKPETEEHLVTSNEAEQTSTSNPSAAPSVPPTSSFGDSLETVDDVAFSSTSTADDFADTPTPTAPYQEDAAADYSENDIKFDLSGTPFSMPEDIPDPFVSGNFDESDMVMKAPEQRPQEPVKQNFGHEAPQKKPFSTEALIDEPTKPMTNKTSAPQQKASLSSADVLSDDGLMDAPINAPKPTASNNDADDSWDLGDLVDIPSTPSASSVLDDEGERSPFDRGPKVESPKAPPWKSSGKKSGERTLLPGQQTPSNSANTNGADMGGSKVGGMISIAILLALVVGTAVFYQNRESVIEALSRWTGTLNSVSQEVPSVAEITPDDTNPQRGDSLPTEAVVRADELQPPTIAADAQPPSTTKVEVLDVTSAEADKPIVADERTELPEDVDRFAALQEAIERKRAERRTKTSAKLEDETADLDPKTLPPEVVTKRNMEIIKETNTALEEYKKALAGVNNPALKPRPGDFFDGRLRGEAGEALAPPATTDEGGGQTSPEPQLETFGNQIIQDPAELVTTKQQDDGIRKLEDFNLSMFDPVDERVRIPQHVAPSLSANTFPPLEVLSFVPDYGIVGLNRGQEGVLLVGESLEGWELVSVFDAYAEFRKGEFKKIVTIKDANR